jgi:hypothetical protein
MAFQGRIAITWKGFASERSELSSCFNLFMGKQRKR